MTAPRTVTASVISTAANVRSIVRVFQEASGKERRRDTLCKTIGNVPTNAYFYIIPLCFTLSSVWWTAEADWDTNAMLSCAACVVTLEFWSNTLTGDPILKRPLTTRPLRWSLLEAWNHSVRGSSRLFVHSNIRNGSFPCALMAHPNGPSTATSSSTALILWKWRMFRVWIWGHSSSSTVRNPGGSHGGQLHIFTNMLRCCSKWQVFECPVNFD